MEGFETPLFYGFLLVHLVSLIVGFGAVIVIDAMGLLWVRGRVPARRLINVAEVTQKVIWIGWGGLVVSGSAMLYLKGYIDALTTVKVFLVAMIGVNGLALHFIKKSLRGIVRYESVPPVHKYHIVVTSVVSQVGWWGALLIGFLHRHIKHYWDWPDSPLPFLFGIAGAWLLAVLIGHIWLDRYHHKHGRR